MSENLIPTPTVLLELKDERQIIEDGYNFLDEKRLLLAAEILQQLDDYQHLFETFSQRHSEAAEALAAAVARHGLEGLQVYPSRILDSTNLEIKQRDFLGVRLLDGQLSADLSAEPPLAADPSPEARRCRRLFHDLIERSAALAALSGNLERLQAEYRRTERRARALEDVILPEVESQLNDIATRIEELDQEEAIRTRLDYSRR